MSIERRRHLALIEALPKGHTSLADVMCREVDLAGDRGELDTRLGPLREAFGPARRLRAVACSTTLDWSGYVLDVLDPSSTGVNAPDIERVVRMTDGVLIATDAIEGPRPRATYALSRALAFGRKPVLLFDRAEQLEVEPRELLEKMLVVAGLDPTSDAFEIPLMYASLDDGWVARALDGTRRGLAPLFGRLVEAIDPPEWTSDSAFMLELATFEDDPAVAPVAIGRPVGAPLERGGDIVVVRPDGGRAVRRARRLFRLDGDERGECAKLEPGVLGAVADWSPRLSSHLEADSLADAIRQLRERAERTGASEDDSLPSLTWEDVASAARDLGDAERLYEASRARAEQADTPRRRAERHLEAAALARDILDAPERVADHVLSALEADPSRLDAVDQLASLLEEAEDWARLADVYRRAIELTRNRAASDRVAALWYQLGRLCDAHLEAPRDALDAYREALALAPELVECREALIDLAASELDQLETARHHLQELRERHPERLDALERLGRLHLKDEALDEALCHLRAFEALGGDPSGQTEAFLEECETGIYNSPNRPLDEKLRRRHLYPDEMDLALNEAFRILYPVLLDWTSEFRSAYGLERDHYIEADEPLAFNNIYRDVAEALDRDEVPDLWRRPETLGLAQGALDAPIVMAGDDLFRSNDERRMAFDAAKTLFLLEKPFYLLGIRDMTDLEAFFVLALQLVHPEIELEHDDALDEAYRAMESAITGDRRTRLREAIDAATDASDEVDLGRWAEAVEDAANRIGLLFAGDLDVARRRIREDDHAFSERDVETRMQDLIEYSLSDDYLALRDELGISVSR